MSDRAQDTEAIRAARYCLNVHGELLCDGPQGHDGGCTFTSAWQLARHLEDELLSLTAYAGATTNELRAVRDGRSVEGEVPAQWYLDMRAERDRLVARLEAARRERDEARKWLARACDEWQAWMEMVPGDGTPTDDDWQELARARAALAAAAPGETTEPE